RRLGSAIALVAAALSLLAARGEWFRLDPVVAGWVQRAGGPGLDHFAAAISWIGLWLPSVAFIAAVAGLIWRAGDPVGAGFVVAAALLRPINGLLKAAGAGRRPPADMVRVLELADGLGFPSGHSFSAMALLVVIAGVAPRVMTGSRLRVCQALCLLAALLMGWSRVRLGAHWPGDVLGGWLWGAAAGLILLSFLPAADDWRHARLPAAGS
ncbi:MAG: phosphatase PAP2 family protein, partial [Chloroflexota bacterium]